MGVTTKKVISCCGMKLVDGKFEVYDNAGRRYHRFKRKSSPSRTVVFTATIKWQVILVIINLALLALLLKLFT